MSKRPSSLRSHGPRTLRRAGIGTLAAAALHTALLLTSGNARAGARVVSLSRRARPAAAATPAVTPPPTPAATRTAATAPEARVGALTPATVATPAAAASFSQPIAPIAPLPAALPEVPVAEPIAPIAPLPAALPEVPVAEPSAPTAPLAAPAPEVPAAEPSAPTLLAAAEPPPLPEAVTAPIAPATTALPVTSAPLPSAAPGAVHDSSAAELAGTQAHGTGVWLSSSAGLVRRSLDFSQDVYHRMRSLGANLYVLRLGAEVYPSFRSSELDGKIGLIAGYEAAVAGSVRDANYSGSYPLHQSELFGGLRVRHAASRVVIGGNLTLGRLSSGLDDHGAANTPAVRYSEIRTAIDASFRLPRGFRARASVGFRVPLAYGEIGDSDWFPRIGGYGFDLAVDADYALSQSVALTASTSLRRYVLEMNSEPEDASSGIAEVAGGAIDAYLGAYLGVLVFL